MGDNPGAAQLPRDSGEATPGQLHASARVPGTPGTLRAAELRGGESDAVARRGDEGRLEHQDPGFESHFCRRVPSIITHSTSICRRTYPTVLPKVTPAPLFSPACVVAGRRAERRKTNEGNVAPLVSRSTGSGTTGSLVGECTCSLPPAALPPPSLLPPSSPGTHVGRSVPGPAGLPAGPPLGRGGEGPSAPGAQHGRRKPEAPGSRRPERAEETPGTGGLQAGDKGTGR